MSKSASGRFYGYNDPAPAVPPPYLVVVFGGVYGYDNSADAVEAAKQLRANRISAKVITSVAQ